MTTAHVANMNGSEGPFAALKMLKYGDQVIAHMGSVKYIYEMRETKLARPYSTSYAFQSKQDAAYLTLITCSDSTRSMRVIYSAGLRERCWLNGL